MGIFDLSLHGFIKFRPFLVHIPFPFAFQFNAFDLWIFFGPDAAYNPNDIRRVAHFIR